MWIASHIGVGSLIYEAVKDEPKWAKWSLVVAGGFVSHWVLDEIGTYHVVSLQHWYDILFIAVNAVSVGLMWWASGRGLTGRARLLPPQFLAGLIAWLIWDWEWLAGSQGHWIHHAQVNDAFPRYVRDVYQLSSVTIQLCLIALLTAVVVKPWRLRVKDLALPVSISRRKASAAYRRLSQTVAFSRAARTITEPEACPSPVPRSSRTP
jgi:hypothetical protein